MTWNRPIKRASSVRGAVYETLRRAIVSGELPPGSKLMTTDLAAQLRVSRTPVREAVQRLIQENLLQQLSTGVVRVREVSRQEIADVMAIRAALEGYAARVAVTRGLDDASLERLKGIWSRMVTLGDTPEADLELVRLNREFHRTLRQASGNSMLDDLLESVGTVTLRDLVFELQRHTNRSKNNLQHKAILDAVANGDAQAAEASARQHVLSVAEELLVMLDDQDRTTAESRRPV